MDQMSLFSAEASGPDIADLSGVLCGQGQITGFARTAARLTVEVDEAWRARVLAAEFGRRGVSAEPTRTEDGRPMIRTAFRRDLIGLARAWLGEAGTGKTLPGRFRLTGAALRLWALASGRPGVQGYLLAVDERAPDTHEPLAEAFRQLGLPAQLVGPKGGGPAVRVNGRRRLATLAELIGMPPPGAEPVWPQHAPARQAV
ncbi:hypothetical protein FHX46_000649 [Amycolatopsis viridis]|uniref:Homing endonuclease LAGLIDADG domain-containing protein n=2 Tax=Amycolatopsis viridis TaxID=185678 RepID=A0ABX0SR32_9PSEU|nr:hypothetical protein [Amycolatopsis viridis]NIH78119.1 hypothetical protein [Amycolatopsis viridis]